MKATKASEVKKFTDIPNVGPATAKDFEVIGIHTPQELKGKDGIELFERLCSISGVRHDPCTADVFLSAIHFMNGGEAKDWWEFTDKRKKLLNT